MFTKLINIISKITDYNTLIIPILLIICGTVSFKNHELYFPKFVVLVAITMLSAVVFPKIIIFIINRQKQYQLKNVAIISNIISYFIGFALMLVLNIDLFMMLLFLTYSINSIILLILLKKDLKISINAFYLSSLISAVILSLGYYAWPISIFYAASLWPNIILKKYSLYQEINSGIISFITVPLIMFILTPYSHTYDIIWIIASFIVYPLVYEIAEYYKINLDKFKSEVIFGFTLLLFAFFAIQTVYSLVSIFITSLIIGIIRNI